MDLSKGYKKIVVVTSRFPFPLEKGDKLRAYHQIKELSNYFEIYLISTSESGVSQSQIDELMPYCKDIQVYTISSFQKVFGVLKALFIKKPFQVGYFHHYSIQRKIDKFINQLRPDHIYCQLIRSSEYVKNYHYCTKTIDYMDAFSKGVERRSRNMKFIRKYIFEREFKQLLNYENSIFEYFEHHTIISEQDKQYIFHKHKNQIKVIPNGIDASFFNNSVSIPKTVDIVFIGNMSYSPNITAAQFIVHDILKFLPPTIRVKIAGASPSKEVLKLSSDQVEVTGYVEDITLAYKSAEVFIAPMFLGTGLQNKLLESMALGIPCITTSLANNGLGAIPEEEILIANTAEEFAQQIMRLKKDKSLSQKIIENGKRFILINYNWKSITKELAALLDT